MALTLARLLSVEQAFPQDFPWFGHAVILLRAAFNDTRFEAIPAQRVDLQVTQGAAGLGVGQSAEGVRKADALDVHVLADRRRVHHRADQVVDQREHREFFQHTVYRGAM
jgi:hypothetical protein